METTEAEEEEEEEEEDEEEEVTIGGVEKAVCSRIGESSSGGRCSVKGMGVECEVGS